MVSLIPIFIDRNIDGEKLLSLDSTKMKVKYILFRNFIIHVLSLFRQWVLNLVKIVNS